MGKLRVMGQGGDATLEWDPTVEDERLEVAVKRFHELVTVKDFMAFTRSAGKSERVKVFDRGAEQIVIVPPMAGG